MDSRQFWSILQTATVEDSEAAGEADFDLLKKELLKLSPEEILAFGREFEAKVDAAYKTDLWGAGYLINGGCSDDGFHYFRCWLVGMGQEVYGKALTNPDSLADVLSGDGPYEASLDAAAPRAWEEKTGRSDTDYYDALRKQDSESDDTDEGEDWDFDDNEEMRRHFPRLCQLYMEEEE